jgi:hypothetical protein
MKSDAEKNPSAVALGNASWATRKKGKTKAQIRADLTRLAELAAKKRSLDKAARLSRIGKL